MAAKAARFRVYLAADGWRWRLVAGNGRILADSGESYSRERDVYRALAAVLEACRYG